MKLSKGRGLLNTLIDKLPFEAHIPTYNFCGPGTKLDLRKDQAGINRLDSACKEHDLQYSNKNADRRQADLDLENKAWERVLSRDSKLSEKAAALFVTNAMKLKRKIGGKLKKKQRTTSLRKAIRAAQIVMKTSKAKNINTLTKEALLAARREIKGKRFIGNSRILKVPKMSGGFLQAVIPILSGLSALGTIVGGVSGIAKAVADFKTATYSKKPTKITSGEGLYIKPYKNGFGIVSKNL